MRVTLPNLPGLAATSAAFKRKCWAIAQALGTGVDNILTTMCFETGRTWSPSIYNAAGSGAVGLIQFMPATARALGTSTTRLAMMSDVEQLDYVGRYFAWFKGRIYTIEDAYLAVLWPAGIGKPLDAVLFPPGTATYRQNAGFDSNHDGSVTKREVCAAIRRLYDSAQGRIEIDVEGQAVDPVEPPTESPVAELTAAEVLARVGLSLEQETGELLDEERRADKDRRDREEGFGEPPTRTDRRTIPPAADPDACPPTPRNTGS